MKRDLDARTPTSKTSRSARAVVLINRLDVAGDADAQSATPNRRDSNALEGENNLGQRVQLFLASSNLPALRHLKVEVDGDAVVLVGQVQTYHEKQLAVEFSRRVAGVMRIVDLIDVRGYTPLVDGPHTEHWRRAGLQPPALS